MKKAFFVLGLLIFAAGAAFAQFSLDYSVSLDTAISHSVDRIKTFTNNAGLKTVILVYTEYPALTEYVHEEIRKSLSEANYVIVSQEEHGIVLTSALDTSQAYQTMTELGVQLIIFGRIAERSTSCELWIRAMVPTARNYSDQGTERRLYEIPRQFIVTPEQFAAEQAEAEAKKAAAAAFDEEPAKFMFNATYSGANSKYRDEPHGFNNTEQHSLQLAMELNVFKILNLGLDFGIKDFNWGGKNIKFTDIMNIGGMLGFKWASIVIDYRFNNGFFYEYENEAEPDTSTGKRDVRIESRTVALMFSTFKILNLGLIWTNATGSDKKDSGGYDDPYYEVNTFGIRAHLRMDYFSYKDRLKIESDLPVALGLIMDLYVDLGIGYNSDSQFAVANGVRGMLGAQLIKEFSKNRYWEIIAGGLDINGGQAGGLGSVVIGAFVRMGFAY